ncbi:MAG: hypothetical protein ABFC92_02795 [Rectinema sp.]
MTHNKWLSRRFWAAIWAGSLATYIVIANRTEFVQLALTLVAIVGVWVGGESYLKKVFRDGNKEN